MEIITYFVKFNYQIGSTFLRRGNRASHGVTTKRQGGLQWTGPQPGISPNTSNNAMLNWIQGQFNPDLNEYFKRTPSDSGESRTMAPCYTASFNETSDASGGPITHSGGLWPLLRCAFRSWPRAARQGTLSRNADEPGDCGMDQQAPPADAADFATAHLIGRIAYLRLRITAAPASISRLKEAGSGIASPKNRTSPSPARSPPAVIP
jgi:hypothetical protein